MPARRYPISICELRSQILPPPDIAPRPRPRVARAEIERAEVIDWSAPSWHPAEVPDRDVQVSGSHRDVSAAAAPLTQRPKQAVAPNAPAGPGFHRALLTAGWR